MPKHRNQRTICIDFDGVIHEYITGDWRDGEIYGAAFPGAIEGLIKLHRRGFKVVIHTTRASDPTQPTKIRKWIYHKATARVTGNEELFEKWLETGEAIDFPFLVTDKKVPAIAFVDDRAIRFVSWPDTLKYFG